MNKLRLKPAHIAALMQWCGDAAEGAAPINLAKRAAELTRLGVIPVRLNHSGEIERPRQHSDAWRPAKTPDAIAAAFRQQGDANGFVVGGLIFRPGRRFVSRLMFTPTPLRQTTTQSQNDESAFRETVDRVVRAGLAHQPETTK